MTTRRDGECIAIERRCHRTAATNVHVTLDVEDVACVSKSKSQTLMRNFSTVTQHAHASALA
jgi:hypothetical protein